MTRDAKNPDSPMNTTALLTYAHDNVLSAVSCVAPADWDAPGACGVWSPKEILAHLTSFEVVLVELLQSLMRSNMTTPQLDAFLANQEQFNETAVDQRRHLTPETILAEYKTAHQQALALPATLGHIDPRQRGIFDWYGPDYDLEDFLIYTFYGHKQEHCAQIVAFSERKQIGKTAVS
jgi:hypothetical protein